MNDRNATIRVITHTAVNDLLFGASPTDLISLLGQPDNALENYTGEMEALYGDVIYRFFDQRFVECTFGDTYQFVINGISVLSVFEWLSGQSDVVDKARFRVSLAQGIAFDFRFENRGSITVFERGRWHAVLGC